MELAQHRTPDELEAGFTRVLKSPKDHGVLKMIVRRPRHEEREVLKQAELSPAEGLVGDVWSQGHGLSPKTQVTLTNSRLIHLLAGSRRFWPLAGDQLYVDMDLSADNLPPGTRLAVGGAILEITEPPHTGCKKFSSRFGIEALKFISHPSRKDLRLRGIYARVVQGGVVHAGDEVRKMGGSE